MDTQPTIKNFLVIALPSILAVFIIFFLVMPKVRENRQAIDNNSEQIVADQQDEVKNQESLIGGNKDEHGCLGPAGYTWSEQTMTCLREWEIKSDDSRRAIKIAVEHLNWQNDATVIEVTTEQCVGCFVVKLEKNSTRDRKTVNLENWQVKTTSLTPQECQQLGGEPVNTVGGATCSEGQKNIGEVAGFISPNICCVPIETK